MKTLAVLVEPANYTLDLIRRIYAPRGVAHVFIKRSSLASSDNCDSGSLNSISILNRIQTVYALLKKYDVFHINGYTEGTCLIFIILNILFFKKPFSIDSDTELIIPKKLAKRLAKWLWLHFLFTRPYCYGFAGGNYGHKELFRHYGMAENRIYLMPMMVDNERYRRKLLDCPHKPFRFAYLGRLIALKQVDRIIEALPNGCELHIVGDGEERLKLETMANGKSVIFHGKAFGDEKIKLLHSFDCLVLYSYYEPWGLVINEALASGIPVIVSNRVGARKDLVEGEDATGLVAKWDSVDDLSDKMRQMSQDFELRNRLAQNAMKRMAKWDYGLYGRQYDKFISDIGAREK